MQDSDHDADSAAQGRLPAPICSDSPDLLMGPKGPLAAGPLAAGRAGKGADKARPGLLSPAGLPRVPGFGGGGMRMSGEGGGFLGSLFACLAPPTARQPVPAA